MKYICNVSPRKIKWSTFDFAANVNDIPLKSTISAISAKSFKFINILRRHLMGSKFISDKKELRNLCIAPVNLNPRK